MATSTIGQLYSKVDPLDPEWLLDYVIVSGDVTLISGAPGIGKGCLTALLAAIVTSGAMLPDGHSAGPPGSVIMISPEDKANFTTIHRLTAAGADTAKVLDLTKVTPGGRRFKVGGLFGGDLPLLRRAIRQLGDCRLVIMDPLNAISSVRLTNGPAVREQVIEPLQALAEETGVAIILVHHPVKSGSIGGSQQLVDALRCVHQVDLDPMDAEVRLLTGVKNNLAPPDVPPLRYTITGSWPHTRAVFLPKVTIDVLEPDGPAGAEPRPGTGRYLILSLLRMDGRPMRGLELAAQTGISYHTVMVLLKRLKDGGFVRQANGAYEAIVAGESVNFAANSF